MGDRPGRFGFKRKGRNGLRKLRQAISGSEKSESLHLAYFASFLCVLCVEVLFLLGCTSAIELRRAELAQLAEWLPGRYDNVEQSTAGGAGAGRQESLAMVIVPVYAPALGERVFYSQEMAADDARRVLGQRLLAFEAAEEGIVQRVYLFEDPLRWRDGHRNPDLFKALVPHDVRPLGGCELIWKKEDERFRGANDPTHCRAVSRASGGSVSIDSRAELGPDGLAMSDRSYSPDGTLVQGREGDPFYRFLKRPLD